MLKNIKNVCILVAICSVMAILLALTNQITAPIIKENEQIKAAAALREVMPDGKTFTKMDLSGYTLPATVTEVHKEDNGQGYVIKLSAKGWKPGMIIMCGVSSDGKIINAICLQSNETNGAEKTYGKHFIGKDAAGVDAVDAVASPTAPLTIAGYKGAMKDALNAVSILKGEVVDLRSPEEKALDQLKADLGAIEKADLSQYELPASVTEAYVSDKGYLIYLTVKGWAEGMEIVCGVSTDNTIMGAICLKSNETNGAEKTYGEHFIGKDAAGVDAVDAVASPTAPLTIAGYKGAMKDALDAARALGGVRTEEELKLDAALPAGNGKFTKLFITEVIEGVDAVYAADNGAGYVAVAVAEEIGEDFIGEFIGIDSDLNIVTAGSTVNTGAAYDAVKAIKASTSEDITASFQTTLDTLVNATTDRKQKAAYKGVQSNVTAVKKTASGNYIIEIKGAGYGINGGDEYHPASGEPIVIRVSLTAEGKIIDCLTVSHSESVGYGAVCGDETYYSQYDGKTADTYTEVEAIAGATLTTNGYMKAIERCFIAVTILEGGAN